jgi:hypothetical protein
MEKMKRSPPSTRSKSRANPSLHESIIRNNNSNNLDKKKNTRVSFEDALESKVNYIFNIFTHHLLEITNTLKTVEISDPAPSEISQGKSHHILLSLFIISFTFCRIYE